MSDEPNKRGIPDPSKIPPPKKNSNNEDGFLENLRSRHHLLQTNNI
jgi:hypothetical protein